MTIEDVKALLEQGEIKKAWHALGELLHHDKGGAVTALDDSGGHGNTNPPPPRLPGEG